VQHFHSKCLPQVAKNPTITYFYGDLPNITFSQVKNSHIETRQTMNSDEKIPEQSPAVHQLQLDDEESLFQPNYMREAYIKSLEQQISQLNEYILLQRNAIEWCVKNGQYSTNAEACRVVCQPFLKGVTEEINVWIDKKRKVHLGYSSARANPMVTIQAPILATDDQLTKIVLERMVHLGLPIPKDINEETEEEFRKNQEREERGERFPSSSSPEYDDLPF
jgi:hypothetical protein